MNCQPDTGRPKPAMHAEVFTDGLAIQAIYGLPPSLHSDIFDVQKMVVWDYRPVLNNKGVSAGSDVS